MQGDLISRSAVINILQELADMETCGNTVSDVGFGLAIAIGRLVSAPAIDAVPVVRCKDCIHAVDITNLTIANRCGLGQKNCMRQRGDDGFGFTGVSIVYPNGFCDEGERMDGDADG